ncbi:MAG: hypothetical protein AAFV62_02055 [Pseudomonadota bacterium]
MKDMLILSADYRCTRSLEAYPEADGSAGPAHAHPAPSSRDLDALPMSERIAMASQLARSKPFGGEAGGDPSLPLTLRTPQVSPASGELFLLEGMMRTLARG